MPDSPLPDGAVEPEPPIAAILFSERIEVARRFTRNLAEQGERLGLIGPLELPRLWSRHVVNSALVASVLREGPVADVGSGAGLPGLVLAIARPEVRFTLIEPMERRTAWLEDQVSELDLENVEVIRSRAEDAPRRSFDQVTARAVGALRTLIPLTAPLARVGGELILMKGQRVADELAAASKQVRAAGLRDARLEELGVGTDAEITRVFRATVV